MPLNRVVEVHVSLNTLVQPSVFAFIVELAMENGKAKLRRKRVEFESEVFDVAAHQEDIAFLYARQIAWNEGAELGRHIGTSEVDKVHRHSYALNDTTTAVS